MTEITKVGFIGIGNMGNPMAGHLVKAGFDVTAYDVRPETLQAFVAEHGGKAAASLAEVARGADALITMLPNDKVVRTAILGDGAEGAAAALAKGAVVIDMSTSDPVGTRALAAALAPRGISVVDAPVMGGVAFARSATLEIMAGGDAAQIERCRPLFSAMGHSLVHSGGIGTAHALKALANYINATSLINAIEAITIGKKFGLDPNLMAEALVPMCTGRNHPIVKKVIPQVLTRKFGTGMAMGFIAKDLKIAIDTAHAIGAAVPLGEKVAELWNAAVGELGYELDQTQVVRYWEEASGVSLAGDDLELLTKSKN